MKRITTEEGVTLAAFKQAHGIEALLVCKSAKNKLYAVNKATNQRAFGISDNAVQDGAINPEARISEWETDEGEIIYYLAVSKPKEVLFEI